MDSYGLPLNWYKSPLIPWLFEHWDILSSNAKTLQEMKSQSCGQYALMFLKYRCRGVSMDTFVKSFKKKDYVRNDHVVGEMVKSAITQDSRLHNLVKIPHQQYNQGSK